MQDLARQVDPQIAATQQQKFAEMMEIVARDNPFYRGRWQGRAITDLQRLAELPLTAKHDLVQDQVEHGPFGRNLSDPIDAYTRMHQTSGTTGRPLRWLDTPASWQWWLDCWQRVYRAAGVTRSDRVFLAFSFGPFIGFWTAFEAAQQMGAMVLAGGGLSSEQRLETIVQAGVTVVVGTPTYALRLADLAEQQGCDLAASSVRVTIHAGEPGAGVPNVKSRIESSWGARCFDHAGGTEMGAWGFSCGHGLNMHVNEREFVVEVLDSETSEPATFRDGRQAGELVLTNLGRIGSPVIRYRTGDYVELSRDPCACGRRDAVLLGGVAGRIDNMVVIRGINVYPSAIENLIREFPEVVEFEVRVERQREMAELAITVELDEQHQSVASAMADQLHRQLSLRPKVTVVPVGSLPRFELKARRFHFS